jgi:hypothetical protein
MKTKNNTPNKEIVSVDTANLSLTDNLRLRMMKAKEDMPDVYMPVYEDHYGKQSDDMKVRIRECVGLRITDEEITSNWELIVKKRKAREELLKSTAELAREIQANSFKRKQAK